MRPIPIAVALVAAVLVFAPLASAGERTLQHSAVVCAPVDAIWEAFMTPEGVKKAWGVGVAEVDFRVGGAYRTAYDPGAKLGGPDTITNVILAYEPKRMIAIKAIAPENAPDFVKLCAKDGFSVIRFDPVAPDRTRVTVTGMGYGVGPEWDKAYEFFDKGNAWTLEKMKKAFGRESAEAETKRAFELLRSIAGSSWIHESTKPDGSLFRARADVRELGRGAFVAIDGWLGDKNGMTPHAHSVYGLDPASGGLRFWQFVEGGTLAQGSVRLEGENRLVSDWNLTTPDGSVRTLPIEIVVEGKDAWRFKAYADAATAESGGKPMLDVPYTRVATLPPGFAESRGAR